MKRAREQFILTLTPEPPGNDHLGREPIYRLKIALKYLLRACGLRCVDMAHRPAEATYDSSTEKAGR